MLPSDADPCDRRSKGLRVRRIYTPARPAGRLSTDQGVPRVREATRPWDVDQEEKRTDDREVTTLGGTRGFDNPRIYFRRGGWR